jgi:hypothetical protein
MPAKPDCPTVFENDGGLTVYRESCHVVENLLLVCTLCRRRHNEHYADLRVMPTSRPERQVAA